MVSPFLICIDIILFPFRLCAENTTSRLCVNKEKSLYVIFLTYRLFRV